MAFYRPTSVRDYLELGRKVLRLRWTLVAVFVATMALAAVAVMRMPKMYKSSALILIQQGQMSSPNANAMVVNLDQRLRTLRPTINSRTTLVELITDLNLYPELRSSRPMDEVVEYARKRIEVEVQGRDLFRVSFVHPVPQTSQVVTERLSHKLIDESVTDDIKRSRGKVDFLRRRTEDLKRELKDWDAKIQQFNEDYGHILVFERSNVNPVTAAREQLKALDSAIRSAEKQRGGRGGGRPGTAPKPPTADRLIAKDPAVVAAQSVLEQAQSKLETLLVTYTNDHPDVVAARRAATQAEATLERLKARAAQALPPPPPPSQAAPEAPRAPRSEGPPPQTELAKLQAERAQLLRQIEKTQTDMRDLPRIKAQLDNLERERKRVEDALDTEVKRLAQAESEDSLISANKGDSFKIQDPANLPEKPSSPGRAVMLAAAGLLAVLIALGVALFRIYLDPTVYNEYEMSRVTDLPVLTSITRYQVRLAGPVGDPEAPTRDGPRG
ncbi:MAG: Wzz/FepE/Etk N-terminal domain-containing protein [Bradymonadia bacterium]